MEVGGDRRERDAVDARARRDERPAGGSRAALRALPVPLRAARGAPAGDPPARLRVPGRRDVLGLELRVPRRPRPARGARDRPRNDAERLPAARARGSTSTPARRSRAAGPSFTRSTPLLQFPLYARAGAVVPFNLRTASGSWWGVDELTHPGRAGFLATNGARLALTGQPHDVQIFVPAASRPARVTIGGRPVAWRWNVGPLPGVVVRLHGPSVQGTVALSGSLARLQFRCEPSGNGAPPARGRPFGASVHASPQPAQGVRQAGGEHRGS